MTISVVKSFCKKIAILTIKGYQKILSPYWPGCCRFYPSCSNYAIEAFNKYGIIKASFKTIKRILRCHPFGGRGYDPVD